MRYLSVRFAAFALLSLAPIFSASTAVADDPLEEVTDQKYTVGADVSLSIKNTDGSMRIYGGDGSEVRIRAIKKAYSAERLRAIVIDVQASSNSVAINTLYPQNDAKWSFADRSGTVDYIVTVPQTAQITKLDLVNGEILVEGLRGGSANATVVNGRITGHNCFGDVAAAVDNGGLEFYYDWWEQKAFVLTGATTNASIKASLPPDAEFVVDAITGTGTITNEYMKKTKDNGGSEVALRRFRATIGSESGPTFKLRTKSGGVRIEHSY